MLMCLVLTSLLIWVQVTSSVVSVRAVFTDFSVSGNCSTLTRWLHSCMLLSIHGLITVTHYLLVHLDSNGQVTCMLNIASRVITRTAPVTLVIFFYPTLPRYPNSKNHRVCPCNICSTKTRPVSFNNRLYLCSSIQFVLNQKMTMLFHNQCNLVSGDVT